MGLTRCERAIELRKQSELMAQKAALLEAQERTRSRKADTARKVILGGAVLAAIRSRRLTQEVWDTIIAPGLTDRDRMRLGSWQREVVDGPSGTCPSDSTVAAAVGS